MSDAPEAEPKTFTQEQVNALLAEQKRKTGEKFADYTDLKAKAEQYDALQEQNKTELQRVAERAEAAERRAVEAESRALKADVAIAKGVPLALLVGATKEELEASADALLAFRGNSTPPPPATVKILTPGSDKAVEKSVAAGAAMFDARRKPSSTKE